MPAPFPGMDPFIESQKWTDFHTRFVTEIGNLLVPRVRPRYEVAVERRIYLEHVEDLPARIIIPDAAIIEQHFDEGIGPQHGGTMTAAAVLVEPVLCTLPLREKKRETYLTVREVETRKVVTVIECLSPENKRRGAKGRREYLRKRNLVLRSPAHLVELDLLRGGDRLPMHDPLPPGDYYALVSRGRRPQAEVYAWPLRHRLPAVPVPLAGDDPDVVLDLQTVFTTVYDRAGYDYTLRYRQPVAPSLTKADAAWAHSILKSTTDPA